MAPSPALSQAAFSSPTISPRAEVRKLPIKRAGFDKKGKGRTVLDEAIQSLEECTLKGKKPDNHQSYYNELISLCISHRALKKGKLLRSHMARTGYEPDIFLNNQFINLYVKCGEVEMARDLFNSMPERNVVSWNALLAGYCTNEHFFDAVWFFVSMIESGQRPSYVTFLSVLQASVGLCDLELLKQIHCQLIKSSCISRIVVGNALIGMYAEFRRFKDSEAVYDSMVEHDAVSMNSLISMQVQNRCTDQALALFLEMQIEGHVPDEFTFGSLLGSRDIEIIEELHAHITKLGLGNSLFTGSTLLDAYARCGKPQAAMKVFNSMSKKSRTTWNSIMNACFQNDMMHEGLDLYLQMGEQGVTPDEYTISIMLKAATTHSMMFNFGKLIHGLAVKFGLHTEATIGNSLITMYSKHKVASESWLVFSSISEPDIISWNSIAQTYIQNEQFEKSLSLFVEMKHAQIDPDKFTFISALTACASLAWQETGRVIHSDLIKRGLSLNKYIGSALIDMYSKFLLMHDARKVFNCIKNKDMIIWNSIISGYANSGHLDQVLNLLSSMRDEKMEPDNFTFATILAACANSSAMQLGRQVHGIILKSEPCTDTAVANTLITMYCRAGSIKEAEKIFSELSFKNEVSWTAMIGGLAHNGNSKEALEIFEQMQRAGVKPTEKTFLALFTACSYVVDMSSKAVEFFKMMKRLYGINPGIDHYACMVDILGRAGRLQEAEDLIKGMPFEPNALVWRILLSACRNYGDIERGERSMEMVVALEPSDSAAYVLLSNLYATVGNWNRVIEIRQLMKRKGVNKEPGKSWIELHNGIHEFIAGDLSHPKTDEIYSELVGLFRQLKDEGYTPGIEYDSMQIEELVIVD
ncbi:putative pentatricopeptide repeat-containing protein At3g15130 [Typha angustifolia]|uniref:putative pentatricopeptide repeat-containing protein At3g15130 n=1 Tax=Typha angustifolia TaxID=59011 RepID=UPI003C2E4A0F